MAQANSPPNAEMQGKTTPPISNNVFIALSTAAPPDSNPVNLGVDGATVARRLYLHTKTRTD